MLCLPSFGNARQALAYFPQQPGTGGLPDAASLAYAGTRLRDEVSSGLREISPIELESNDIFSSFSISLNSDCPQLAKAESGGPMAERNLFVIASIIGIICVVAVAALVIFGLR